MLVDRRLPWRSVLTWGATIVAVAAAWAAIVFALHARLGWQWIKVPFLPVATIGTAVAFYVGFKNNSAYDRFWEGRKIWGGIVNASRSWGTAVMAYVDPGDESERAQAMRRELIYRQLAWVNALRLQLRKKSRFFDKPAVSTKRRLERHAVHMRNDWDAELLPFTGAEELAEVSAYANPATQLMKVQGRRLAELVREERLDLFRQIDLMHLVEEMYTLQGKCERIKNTPLPRQYAEFSRIFTRVFLFLVPFGLLDVFDEQVKAATSTTELWTPIIPMVVASALVSWVFFTMEGIGDSSEDPFERSMNDVPMNALSRTIEIDLRQMLDETDLPAPETKADNVLY